MSTDLPIDLRLSEEQRISREGMRRFASQTMAPGARAADEAAAADPGVLAGIAGFGLTLMSLPEALGGAGLPRSPMKARELTPIRVPPRGRRPAASAGRSTAVAARSTVARPAMATPRWWRWRRLYGNSYAAIEPHTAGRTRTLLWFWRMQTSY